MQLERCKQNQQVFQKIASQMQNESDYRTYQQCREKTKELRKEYKKWKTKFAKQASREDNTQYLITKFVYFEIYWVIDQWLNQR